MDQLFPRTTRRLIDRPLSRGFSQSFPISTNPKPLDRPVSRRSTVRPSASVVLVAVSTSQLPCTLTLLISMRITSPKSAKRAFTSYIGASGVSDTCVSSCATSPVGSEIVTSNSTPRQAYQGGCLLNGWPSRNSTRAAEPLNIRSGCGTEERSTSWLFER